MSNASPVKPSPFHFLPQRPAHRSSVGSDYRDQNFGAGGSPSRPINGVGQASSPTLATITAGAFQRFTATMTLPSIAGKTIGTNGDDRNELVLVLSQDGAPVGLQTGTFIFAGVQLEIGSVATPPEKPDHAARPRQVPAGFIQYAMPMDWPVHISAVAGGRIGHSVTDVGFSGSMRTVPTVIIGAQLQGDINVGVITADVITANGVRIWASSTSSGQANFSRQLQLSADL